MKNSTYDTIKMIALIVIPAIAGFYGVIGSLWKLEYTNEIVSTINAFGILIGAIVQKASADYSTLNKE